MERKYQLNKMWILKKITGNELQEVVLDYHLGKGGFVFRSQNRHHLQNLQSHKPHPLRSELGGILSRLYMFEP